MRLQIVDYEVEVAVREQLGVVGVIEPVFSEAVDIELADERVEIIMIEEVGEHLCGEFLRPGDIESGASRVPERVFSFLMVYGLTARIL